MPETPKWRSQASTFSQPGVITDELLLQSVIDTMSPAPFKTTSVTIVEEIPYAATMSLCVFLPVVLSVYL